jgi:hypothetical protein
MRWINSVLMWSVLALGCSSPAPVGPKPIATTPAASVALPVATVASAKASASVAPVPPPPPPPTLTPAERLTKFLEQLQPITTSETLLLGLEMVPSEGYGPLYGEGAHAAPEDKLHTLILHVHDGKVELAGELPFLAIPQEKNFLFMGVASYERDDTEAERKRQGAKFGLDDEYGSKVYWYVASSLWQTTERKKVDSERIAERNRLKSARRWGDFSSEDVNYVTSRAMCKTTSSGEWTGGALAFRAHESESLVGFSKILPAELSNYTDDAGLLKFAKAIVADRDPEKDLSEVSLDKPYNMIWAEVNWRKESRACLARKHGRVSLTGVIELPNNSARSSEWEAPVKDAPPELAGLATPLIPWEEIENATVDPKPVDAIVSPGKAVIMLQWKDHMAIYGKGSATPLLSIPLGARIVMAEWASGNAANLWSRIGDPPKTAVVTAAKSAPRP